MNPRIEDVDFEDLVLQIEKYGDSAFLSEYQIKGLIGRILRIHIDSKDLSLDHALLDDILGTIRDLGMARKLSLDGKSYWVIPPDDLKGAFQAYMNNKGRKKI